MTDVRKIKNIALVGFMGVGKSSVGRIVAEHLRFDFVDTDELIQQRVGCSVTEIFAREGEPAFRAHERAVVTDLAARERLVIATGGGLICEPGNIESLREHALIVCLWASANTIWERVRSQSHRPLLQSPDPKATIDALLAKRGPAYRQAGVLVGSEFRTPTQVAQQVVHHFHLATR